MDNNVVPNALSCHVQFKGSFFHTQLFYWASSYIDTKLEIDAVCNQLKIIKMEAKGNVSELKVTESINSFLKEMNT